MARKNRLIGIIMAVAALLALLAVLFLRPGEEIVIPEAEVAAPAEASAPAPRVEYIPPPRAEVASPPPVEEVAEDLIPASEIVRMDYPAVAPQPTASAAVSSVRVTVLEEGSRKPLPSVRVWLVKATPGEQNREQNDWQQWRGGAAAGGFGIPGGWQQGERPRREDNPLDRTTDENGIVVFANVPLDTYEVTARYGQGPRVTNESPVVVVANLTQEALVEYPAPQPFNFRLLNESKEPVANEPLEVGAALFQEGWFGGGGNSIQYTPVVTDSQGRFTIMSYEGVRGASVKTTKQALFSGRDPQAERGRRDRGRFDSAWMNPWFLTDDLDAEDEEIVYMRTDVVTATAHLLNPPKPQGEGTLIATVRADNSFYPGIAVENDRFTFTAIKGVTANITIMDRTAGGAGFFGRESILKELAETLPVEPGNYEFDIEFEKRRRVDVYVYHHDGRPAQDVRVIANAFATLGEGTTAMERSNNRGGRQGRGGGNPRESWRGPRDQGQASLVSRGSDSSGHVELELPQTIEYLFGVDRDTLPTESKGGDTIVKTWEELEKGTPVVLRLKPSSIIWGEVLDASGQPAPGVQVNLRGPDIPWNSPDFRTVTDESGIFELNIPPTRLPTPDPDEPPAHYIFAYHQSLGGGLGKAVIDDAETPVNIRLSPFATARLQVTEGGQPVQEIEYIQLYTVPGFNVPITARSGGRRRDDAGIYNFPALLKGVSSVTIWKRGAEGSTQSVFIEDHDPDLVQKTVELGVM